MLNRYKVMSLEELQEAKSLKKHLQKGVVLGNQKINMDYFYQLQDTAEYNAAQAYKRKCDLITIYTMICEKMNKKIEDENELEKITSDALMDKIVDLLCFSKIIEGKYNYDKKCYEY
jgi:DNA-binding transcriptional regulator GbsR (MarR family)